MEPRVFFSTRTTGQRPARNLHIECDFCHICGHTRDSCRNLMKCEYCHITGHLKGKCYKLIGYPPDFKSKKKNPTVNGNLAYGNNISPDEENLVSTGPMNHVHVGGNCIGHSNYVGSHLAHTGSSAGCSSGSKCSTPPLGPNFTIVPMIAPQQQSHLMKMLDHTSPGKSSAHMVGISLSNSVTNPTWIVDTRATHNMVW